MAERERREVAPSGLIQQKSDITDHEQIFSLWDLHWPEIDEGTIGCLRAHMKESKRKGLLRGFVFGGDALDNRAVNPHCEGEYEEQYNSYFEDLKSFETKILDPMDELLDSVEGVLKIYIRGNHEDFEDRYVRKHPEFAGMQSHLQLNLKERGWRVIPVGNIWRYGKLNFFHGEWLSSANHAKRALEMVDGNCVYGHFHSPQSATKILSYKHRQKYVAQCMPIGGRVNANWVRCAPNGWVTGYGVTSYRKGGAFNHYAITTFDGACTFGDRTYTAI